MKVLSIDVSASSLRVLKVCHDEAGFHYETIYRVPNDMVYVDGHYHWDNEKILKGIQKGIVKACQEDPEIQSVGIDTWGVDYVPLDEKGNPLAMAMCYRDERCQKAMEAFLRETPYWEVYKQTGIQRCNFNTIFQLYDDLILEKKKFASFLLMPDYLSYRLTGEKRNEVTNLSTGALYNPLTRDYAEGCLAKVGLTKDKMPRLIRPGEQIGTLHLEGAPELPVIAVCSHDTASAIASMPLTPRSFYISSGTWSLLGAELDHPFINKETFEKDFTNEMGYDDHVCFLKNVMGFFMIQELRHEFNDIPFGDILKQANESKVDGLYIDVDDLPFASPRNMKAKILEYLDKTHQKHGDLSLGDLAHIVYESLAIKYALRIQDLEKLVGFEAESLVVTGGGTNIPSLLQRIADLSGLVVKTGEAEATAYGNAMVQFLALKEFTSLSEAREALFASSQHDVYSPRAMDKKAVFEAYTKATKGN
ncbi:MAG: FGGY family carbohydrate kinase [Candidatus Enteromonas sp.]|nr:FGGY family carbohydrate kinase [Candidatus Enteromonas sp.]